jgi:hypothetical protein
MAKQKQENQLQPLSILVLVIILGGIGAFVYNNHFAPMERRHVTPATYGQNEILKAAQVMAPNDEINGIKVELKFKRQIRNFAIVEAFPEGQQTDPMRIILQKANGQWHVIAAGTAFPEFEGKFPDELLH